jgi:hypothetical protein
LEPPRSLTGSATRSGLSTSIGNSGYAYEKDDDDVSIDSPTDQTWFLPHSPGLPPQQVLAQDEGKLGVLSAINIIVGKTMGVGAYTVPSAIFSGVGSVGSTFSSHVRDVKGALGTMRPPNFC